MKLKVNRTKNKNKLLKLKLINSRVLNKKTLLESTNSDYMVYQLKKALKILFQFHINNKKILFIGGIKKLDSNFLKKIKNIRHKWVTEADWRNGQLTNKKNVTKYDLIILFEDLNQAIVNESLLYTVPIISFCKSRYTNIISSYKITGNFNFYNSFLRENFVLELLESTFKRADLLKKQYNKIVQKMLLSHKKQYSKFNETNHNQNVKRNVHKKKK